jgi:hypothetical protein
MATGRIDGMDIRIVSILAAGVLVAGCASVRVTDPPRTATEQFLLSVAASGAVDQLTFENLRGRNAYVDTTYFAAAEQAFVLGRLRAHLLMAGVQITPDRSESDVVVEVRSGGVGIDRYDYLFGLPALFITGGPQTGPGQVPIATPELAIIKNQFQTGVADVAYVAYWRETGEVVASSGPFVGRAFRDDWWFLGLGPRSVGDIPPVERRSR